MKLLKRKPPPYPIHGYSLGMLDTPREPYTWWDCGHGHQDMGSPYEPPTRGCFQCSWQHVRDLVEQRTTDREPPVTNWRPADLATARAQTMQALDGKADLVARHDEPVR